MKNMRDLLPEKYWNNVKNGKLVSDSWRIQTSSNRYDSHYNADWIADYLGLKNMINIVEDDYWDYYSKGQIYNYEIDYNKLLEYLKNCGYNFD